MPGSGGANYSTFADRSKKNFQEADMPKKRILEKIRIDEISGVDSPAQQGAAVTIMKRQEPPMNRLNALEDRALELKDRADTLGQTLAARAQPAPPSQDFDALVAAEIAKGCPASVAGQRVVMRYGTRPDASRVNKSASVTADFMAEVDAVMIAKRCSRTEALTEARKRNPELFARYQAV
jgi:hypothetical protein